MVMGARRRLPSSEPMSPPTKAAGAHHAISTGTFFTLATWPSKPEAEFTRMNATETPAVLRVSAQPRSRINGLRKIPPPTPVSPERNPMPEPKIKANGSDTGFCSAGAWAVWLNASRHAANSSTQPRMIL